jgi:hypothetical protein
MIDDEELKVKRNQWLHSEGLRDRYVVIRKVVEGIFNDSKHSVQLKWFTIHGSEHSKALENTLYNLIPMPSEPQNGKLNYYLNGCEFAKREQLTESERFFLIVSAWLHDLGMIRQPDKDKELTDEQIRDNHHSRSEKYIAEKFSTFHLTDGEASLLGIMAFYHRRRCPIDECPEKLTIAGHEGAIRVRLLAAYLRLADALHVDFTRAPAKEYAILLTYNIPTSSKLHWLKSNFVLGISTDITAKTITVTFKALTDKAMKDCVQDANNSIFDKENKDNRYKERENIHAKENIFQNTLDAIYDEIYQDLKEELDSVKEVLIRGNISCFLNVKKETCQVEIKDQFLNDIKTILHHYPSLNNPSGSSLHKIIVDTLLQICKIARDEPEEIRKDRIDNFLRDIKENILEPRKSYIGLHNLYNGLTEITEEKISENKKKKLKDLLRKDLEEKNIDERIKSIKDKHEICKNKPLTELEIFLYHKRKKLEEDANGVRKNASKFFSKIISNDIKDDELEYIKKLREIFNERYRFFLPKSEHKDGDANENDDNAKNDSKTNAEKQKEKFEKEFNRKRVNILLFGYSKLVIKTLCGFRDALIKNIIEDLSKESLEKFAWHKDDLEKTASNFFRIFVCEGQPKNRLGWGGKVVYHDGTNYAKKLHEYGFTNIFLIPDATAASLMDIDHSLDIHFVIMGANSYKLKDTNSEKKDNDKPEKAYFIHSAGHAMVAKLTQKLKEEMDLKQEEKQGIEKKVKPILIFSVTTEKRDEPKEPKQDEVEKQESTKQEGQLPKVEYEEGWAFARFKDDEEIKKRFFFPISNNDRETIKKFGNDFMIYNPKLDEIPYEYADVVIDENGYKTPQTTLTIKEKDVRE